MSAFACSYSVNVYEVSTMSSGEKSLSPSVVITCEQNKNWHFLKCTPTFAE